MSGFYNFDEATTVEDSVEKNKLSPDDNSKIRRGKKKKRKKERKKRKEKKEAIKKENKEFVS